MIYQAWATLRDKAIKAVEQENWKGELGTGWAQVRTLEIRGKAVGFALLYVGDAILEVSREVRKLREVVEAQASSEP